MRGASRDFSAGAKCSNRFIFYQEQMIRQAAELDAAGIRVHHVRYAELVEKTGMFVVASASFWKSSLTKKCSTLTMRIYLPFIARHNMIICGVASLRDGIFPIRALIPESFKNCSASEPGGIACKINGLMAETIRQPSRNLHWQNVFITKCWAIF